MTDADVLTCWEQVEELTAQDQLYGLIGLAGVTGGCLFLLFQAEMARRKGRWVVALACGFLLLVIVLAYAILGSVDAIYDC